MIPEEIRHAFERMWEGRVPLHSILNILQMKRSDAIKIRYLMQLPDRDEKGCLLPTCTSPHDFGPRARGT